MLLPKFPNLPQFSRVVVRVNLKDGSLFADAADEAAPFGDLPWFEKGISGMTIDGTKLVPTPIPMGSPEDNLSTSKYTEKLSSDWKVDGDIEVSLKGIAAMEFRGELMDEAPEKADQSIPEYFGFGRGGTLISNLTHPNFKDTAQLLVLKAHMEDRVAPEDSASVLLNPWLDRLRAPVFKATQRQSLVQFPGPEKQVTTSTWDLPLDIRVEKLPAEVKMESDIADFSHSCTQDQNRVTCTRTYVLKKADFKDQAQNPSLYRTVKIFFDEVAQHDQEVILLRKQ